MYLAPLLPCPSGGSLPWVVTHPGARPVFLAMIGGSDPVIPTEICGREKLLGVFFSGPRKNPVYSLLLCSLKTGMRWS